MFPFLDPSTCFEYERSRLSFASLVSSLASFSRSWSGYEEILMVSGSVKVHEV